MPRFIPGDGPKPCDLMYVGERPGRDEDRLGRSWVGKAGRELWRYTWQFLHRERASIYATNLVKDFLPGDPDPTAAEIERDKPLLMREILAVRPWFIASLGRWSTRWFLGDVDMETVHGIPHTFVGNDYVAAIVVPVFHPAAGLHDTEIQAKIAYDFMQLDLAMKGLVPLAPPVDQYPRPIYRESPDAPRQWAAVDTEGSTERPWGLSWATRPGAATVRREAMVRRYGPVPSAAAGRRHWLLHNAMHDLPVLRAMGIDLRAGEFEDTMVKAYLLCVEPQGLKELARRHLGMGMSSYDEIIGQADRRLALEFLKGAQACLNSLSQSGLTASSATAPSRKRLNRASAGGQSATTSRRAK